MWTNAEIILISLSEIVYYPIYAWLLKWKKRKVLKNLQDYLGASKRDIWKDMRARELSYTIKLSSSSDYSLAYLDILNYDHSVLEWENTTQFPISIILCNNINKYVHLSYHFSFRFSWRRKFLISLSNQHHGPVGQICVNVSQAVSRTGSKRRL